MPIYLAVVRLLGQPSGSLTSAGFDPHCSQPGVGSPGVSTAEMLTRCLYSETYRGNTLLLDTSLAERRSS